MLLAAGILWGRCVVSVERQAEALATAAIALDAALAGDGSAWERAEGAYGYAARGALLDSYPLWVLEIIRHWRQPTVTTRTDELAPFLRAVRERDYQTAEVHASGLEVPRAR